MTIYRSTDPGFENVGLVEVEWQPKVRRCWSHQTIVTKPTDSTNDRLRRIIDSVNEFYSADCSDDYSASCEDIIGARARLNASGKSSAGADMGLIVQGAIMAAALTNCHTVVMVRTLSVYAALGCLVKRRAGESDYMHSKNQKAATRKVVGMMLSGTEDLTEHEIDACAIAIAAALGKGTVL